MSSIAFAAETATKASFEIMSLLPFFVILGIFYLMLVRPQLKKQKEHQTMLGALKVGDKVITSGGIIGTIAKFEDENVAQLEVAEGVKMRFLRALITEKLSKDLEANLFKDKQRGKKQVEKEPATEPA